MAVLEATRDTGTADRVAELNAIWDGRPPRDILEAAVGRLFAGGVAVVSSFGAESSVLLHMIAALDGNLPVLFVNTGKHFGETLAYRDRLVAHLALTNVRDVMPDPLALAVRDPDGMLFNVNADHCCALRKTEPLDRALEPYRAWITGRKRFQTRERSDLAVFEEAGGRVKINPLAGWSANDIADYRDRHGLPVHSLVAQGFRSIGCMPCTTRTAPGEDPRAGRWRGSDKTECGIHLPGFERDGSGI